MTAMNGRFAARQSAAVAAWLALLGTATASADVGATGVLTALCVPSGCCGQIQFDNQTHAVFGNSYNIVQSGVQSVASVDTAIVLQEQGTFNGSWTQAPTGAFTFGASGSFLCADPGAFCTGFPVAFAGDLSNPTFPPVLQQFAWTFDGTLNYTTSPAGSVPPSCGFGLFYEGLVAFNAFLVGQPTPAGSDVSVTLPVSYFDTLLGQTLSHTVTVTYAAVSQPGTTSATAFSSAPGQVPPGFAVRVGGRCSQSHAACESSAECPVGEFCFGPFNGGFVDITTDAVYEPPIEICIGLDPDWVALAMSVGFGWEHIRLAHDEGGTFVNRVTSVEPATNTICATVDSLSFFALGLATCPATPMTGCRAAEKSTLTLRDADSDGKDKLIWKWLKGAATTQQQFADPTDNADYALCLYAGATPTLIQQAVAGSSPDRWRAVGEKGYRYADASGASNGVFAASLNGGDDGTSKVLFKARGAGLPDMAADSLPIPPAGFPLRVQLLNSGNGLCWEQSYSEADVKKNTADQFKAKHATP